MRSSRRRGWRRHRSSAPPCLLSPLASAPPHRSVGAQLAGKRLPVSAYRAGLYARSRPCQEGIWAKVTNPSTSPTCASAGFESPIRDRCNAELNDRREAGYHRGVTGPPGATETYPLETPVYALGSDVPERERLRRQSAELRAQSAAFLDRVGVQAGQSALDLGCGPLGVIDLLSDRVGPGGRVVGMDIEPANV